MSGSIHEATIIDGVHRQTALCILYGRPVTRILEGRGRLVQNASVDAIAGNDVRELVRENMLFHSTIHAAAESPRLSGMIRRVIELPLVYKSYVWYSPDQKRISAHYHRQITNAMRGRDGDRAEHLMREHVFEARDLLVGKVGSTLAEES